MFGRALAVLPLLMMLVVGARASLAAGSRSPARPAAVRSHGALANDCPAGGTLRVAAGDNGILGPGAWSWFADPRAIAVNRPIPETIVGWIDPAGAVTVAAVDLRCGLEQSGVVGRVFHDDHSDPALLLEPDGRVTAFWSAHGGPAMFYRTTLAPGDVSAWGPVQQIPSRQRGSRGFTYPNPVLLSGEHEREFLFWRGADWSADYATRALGGSWRAGRRLISNPGQRPYLKVASNGRDRIALAYTDGHPREMTTSIYYAGYRRGWLRHAGGRRIARLGDGPIRPRRGDLVYNGPAHHASGWVWDVALDSRQRPVIVYATFRSVANHEYWYARFDGRHWTSHPVAFAGPSISPGTIESQYSGGIVLDHAHPSIVYLSRKVGGWFEIERWRTVDGGRRWRHTTVIRTAGADDLRPVVPRRSSAGQIRLLWLHGHYGSYRSYGTSIGYLR